MVFFGHGKVFDVSSEVTESTLTLPLSLSNVNAGLGGGALSAALHPAALVPDLTLLLRCSRFGVEGARSSILRGI